MSESVELATILLVDLVGSTRLETAVGPVRADELLDEYFGLLHEAIDASGGQGFKNTGDGLFVVFSSASAAVGCAVLTQQLFERRYRDQEQQLHVRIGLGTGESTVRDGDYFGMPSIEAARLCDKAPADGILVSPVSKTLAGRVEGARFESVGELELKGIPEPMEAFAVLWEPLADESGVDVGSWPVPAVLRSVPRTAYVGRVVERGLIERSRARARSGGRQLVLLSGEPGIGKTRLASYSALASHAEGFAVCWGACSEDLAAPYEPWIAVCSQLVEHAPEDVLAAYVARHGGEIGRLARNLARRLADAPAPQSSDSETERFLLFKAVGELLSAVAYGQPLCVVLDDFHWADGQSVALLKYVAQTVEQAPLQILVTYRDSDLTKDHPLTGVLADLRRTGGVERIALAGLGVDEVAELLSAAAGHELDADALALAGELATETGGNPFFVGEILRSLTESGAITFDETARRWSIDQAAITSLPESVREVVEHRIDRLGAQGREALTIAAVIGRSFDVELLTQLVEMSEAEVLDQLEAAVGATLLRESTDQVGKFTFEHALINHTLYQGLGATRRARLHERVAQALEQVYGRDSDERLPELALHWRLATVSVDRPKAAAYAARAGQQALDRLAPAEAARLFVDAVELLGAGDTAERCRALIGLGEAQRLIGNAAYRETLLEASRIASGLADAELAASAVLENSRGLPTAIGDTDQELLAAIVRALELDDRSDLGRRARLLGIHALELSYHEEQLERRREIAEEAIRLARESGDPAALSSVLRDTRHAVWSADTMTRCMEMVEEEIRAAELAQDPALLWWARLGEHLTSAMAGRLDRAAEALSELERIADELEQPALRWHAAASRDSWEQLHGHLEAADERRERTLALGQEAVPLNSALYYAANLVETRAVQGRAEEVIAMTEGSVATYPGIPAWRAGLGVAYCRTGRLEEGRAIVEDGAQDRFEHIPHDSARMTTLALYAYVAALTGSVEAAQYLYELIEPWADQVVYSDALGYGHARMYLGALAHTLGRHDLAVEQLEFACGFHEQHGILYWAADSHLWLAQALAGRDDAAGTEHYERALELAREHGYGAIEKRAAVLMGAEVSAET